MNDTDCIACGHKAEQHAIDDEERRECMAEGCQCQQYECAGKAIADVLEGLYRVSRSLRQEREERRTELGLRREAREKRLRELGFEELTAEQKAANLEVTLMDWCDNKCR